MLPSEERTLLDQTSGALVAADMQGRIAHLNPAAEALFGHPAREAEGKPLTLLMPPRMRVAHAKGFLSWERTGESRLLGRTVRVPALRADGREIEVELTLRMFQRPDGTRLVVANVHETTQGAGAEAGVVELETRFQRRMYQLL